MHRFHARAIDKDGTYVPTKCGMFKQLGINPKRSLGRTESGEYRITVVAPKGFTPEEVQRAIYCEFDHACGHWHDSCGCLHVSTAEVRRGKRREYTLLYTFWHNN